METIDRAQEWRRLKELYRDKADEELAAVAAEAYQLTDLARQALEAEIGSRHLDIEIATEPPEPVEEPEPIGPEEFDPETLNLVPFSRLWNIEDARTTKNILDYAGIPSYFGDDNLEKVDDYRGSFEGGVDLKVRDSDTQRASSALYHHWPESQEDDRKSEEDGKFIPPRCPKCQSEDIVFESRETGLTGNAAFHAKFHWSCDTCGHEWEDDGVVP